MAKRAKKSAPKAMKASKSGGGVVSKAIGVGKAVMGLGGGKSSKGGKRRHKKSALWFAKEIQRLKLKRKYMKEKFKL